VSLLGWWEVALEDFTEDRRVFLVLAVLVLAVKDGLDLASKVL
jgi:hypothetical protein